MTTDRKNEAVVTDPTVQEEFLAGFNEGRDDSGTTDHVSAKVEMTAEDLILRLADMPADAKVALITKGGEAEEFSVDYDPNTGWVLLQG